MADGKQEDTTTFEATMGTNGQFTIPPTNRKRLNLVGGEIARFEMQILSRPDKEVKSKAKRKKINKSSHS